MKRLATNFVQRPLFALLGWEPLRSGTELARHQLGKSGDAKAGDDDHFIAPLGKHCHSECAAGAFAP